MRRVRKCWPSIARFDTKRYGVGTMHVLAYVGIKVGY